MWRGIFRFRGFFYFSRVTWGLEYEGFLLMENMETGKGIFFSRGRGLGSGVYLGEVGGWVLGR